MKSTKDYLLNKFPEVDESVIALSNYFDQLEIELPEQELNATHVQNLVQLMIKDFIEYRIDADTLSDYCGKICHLLEDNSWQNTNIYNFVSDLAELEVDLRVNPERAKDTLEQIIVNIKN